jgi:hypothetical protein
MQPQRVTGEINFTQNLLETPSFPSFNTAKIRLSNKSISSPKRQKKNKNHFTPIQEQACALTFTYG